MAYEYLESLDNVARQRYKTKLVAAGLESCPYKLEAGRWVHDPKQWPNVQYPDIFSYLIETPGVYTMESMKNYRSLEAHNYSNSGWVDKIYHYMTGTGLFVMKGNVKPSQRLNDNPHHPWVVVKKEGVVTAAHCDCMAGLGESCSHVAALLFTIEFAVRKGETTATGTDKLCLWNQCFVKKVEPAPVSSINFYKEKSKERLREKGRCRDSPISKASWPQQRKFLAQLAVKSPKSVTLSTFDEFADPFVPSKPVPVVYEAKLPINLRTLYTAGMDDVDAAIQKAREKATNVTDVEHNYLIESTTAQSDSAVWHDMRVGRVTASKVHAVLHTDQQKPARSVLKGICQPTQDIGHIPAIKWGRDNESTAINVYVVSHKGSHGQEVSVKVVSTGLWLHKQHPFIGASPDALVHCSSCGYGVLEVKCPYKYKDCATVEQIVSDKHCYLDENGKLKEGHTYYAQVQTQIEVCGASFADFVLWTPQIVIIQRIQPDCSFASVLLSVVPTFWYKYCLPELVTRQLEMETNAGTNTVDDNMEFEFCLCKVDSGDTMIGCDNPDCPHKWYHLSCLKRKTAPKGDWYCRKCTQRRLVLSEM